VEGFLFGYRGLSSIGFELHCELGFGNRAMVGEILVVRVLGLVGRLFGGGALLRMERSDAQGKALA